LILTNAALAQNSRMQARVLQCALILGLAGCASNPYGFSAITGVAPGNDACRVDVLDHDNGRVLSSQPVRGSFSIGFGLGENYRSKVDLAGYCSGRQVVLFPGVVPGAIGVTDLGVLKP